MSNTAKTREDEAARGSTPSNVTVIPAPVTPPRKKRRSRRSWIFALLVLAVVGTGYYAWSRQGAPPATTMITQAVTRGDIEESVTAVGTLDAVKSVDAGAQVSGQLKSLHVGIGDKVEQNQLIAEIDPASIENRIEIDEAELANLEAQLVSKKAQLVLKQANIERQRNLVATNSVSQSTLDQAVADHAAAGADVQAIEAQIRKQKATLAGDRVDLGYTKIYAPMAGTIVDDPAKEGQTLNANQTTPTIVTIADLSTMTVKAQVSEADVGKLKLGMDAYFTLLGQPGKRFTGKLRQIEPMPDTENNVVLYYALFDVPNPTGELMMSMSAQVFFVQAAAKNVLVVPSAALRTMEAAASDRPARAEVTVVAPSGATQTRPVEVGVRNRVSAEIVSGLQEGEKVVVDAASATNGSRAPNATRRGMRMPPMF
ncbi:macrolide transporter subunit MacA [Sinorhizobium meliloti WSM1022]|jgi:membrane fusion protein, macrolide-specific efflux system|uniref:macrolide transporter subunit MacA n=1 Tax=Rhizobium meliloti TaxID=382 RepID=UPI00041DA6C9|nr:macrolide transporter subunit MacA [Sinorhizobium meliloti]ASQ03580.1 macrolide transporter subunit MacA [Sinorhizobium meliloti]MCO6426137.1 macrolide transporter subunit MacA [Sinorhizobium meliloti]MDW9408216.1 macrolide transporter subunit MacA [Sinorhizobium meliloti]MDW9445458.1 macrolide transporter subunit MacA [Sinorhizobium meliloti]MDW9453421.1 macrolide transporter subunit MacA [Sinorhizobium meliloti]